MSEKKTATTTAGKTVSPPPATKTNKELEQLRRERGFKKEKG